MGYLIEIRLSNRFLGQNGGSYPSSAKKMALCTQDFSEKGISNSLQNQTVKLGK